LVPVHLRFRAVSRAFSQRPRRAHRCAPSSGSGHTPGGPTGGNLRATVEAVKAEDEAASRKKKA